MSRVLPILFNTDMVRAILDGRKTVTRRAVRYKYSNTEMEMRTDKYGTRLVEIQKDMEGETFGKNPDGSTWHKLRGYIEPKPPYQPGDILYVRETWTREDGKYYYRADFDSDYLEPCETLSGGYPAYCRNYPGCNGCAVGKQRIIWSPSIHMPKEAARIWLKVMDVRAERLQEITPDQCITEGISEEEIIKTKNSCFKYCGNPKEIFGVDNAFVYCFRRCWNSTIKKSDHYTWDANPWVWVIEFERCEQPQKDNIGI